MSDTPDYVPKGVPADAHQIAPQPMQDGDDDTSEVRTEIQLVSVSFPVANYSNAIARVFTRSFSPG